MKTTTLTLSAGVLLLLALASPSSAVVPWGDDGWSYRMPITAKPAEIDGPDPHLDFPLLVSLDGVNHPSVFVHAKSDGSDLLFTRGDGATVLAREIATFDATAQKAEIWVRVDSLSDTENTFFLYYGNPDTTITAPASAAWNSKYRAVYHFADDPGGGVLTDSSPAAAHVPLEPAWTSSDVTSGQIHQAWLFNGSSHYLQALKISTQDSSFAVSGWALNTTDGTDFFIQANPTFWHTSTQTTNISQRPDFAGDPANVRWDPEPILKDGNYHHFCWVFDGVNDTIMFYYDGEPQQPRVVFPAGSVFYYGTPINPAQNQPVGVYGPMFFNNGDLMNGGGDEFRVHETMLSEAWVRTEYRNQRDPSNFLEFGAEEEPGATAANPVDHNVVYLAPNHPNPFRGFTSVQFHLPVTGHARLAVYDVAGRVVAVLVDSVLPAGQHDSGWNGRTFRGQRAATGVYFLRLTTPQGASSIKMLLQR